MTNEVQNFCHRAREVIQHPPWKNQAKKPRFFPNTEKDEQIQHIEKIKREKEIQLAAREQKKRRKLNEKREMILMKLQDFDITDSLAGFVEPQQSFENLSEVQQEFGEEAYFEYK